MAHVPMIVDVMQITPGDLGRFTRLNHYACHTAIIGLQFRNVTDFLGWWFT